MNKKNNAYLFPIDIVYLWVDGNDIQWQKEKESYQKQNNINDDSTNMCRFIDNQELKYSLRSVMKNAPWINNIFIVTNGQVPNWLNINHPKIKIVNHKDIMPKESLPTFNSEAIETCIVNIPELSEHFLYANDDMFINKPIEPSYFFTNNGKPIVRLKKHHWSSYDIEHKLYQRNVTYTHKMLSSKYNILKKYSNYEATHCIDAYQKSALIETIHNFEEHFKKTCMQKFRKKDSIQRIAFLFYMIAKNRCVIDISKKSTNNNLLISLESKKQMSAKLKKYNPTLICINDNEWTLETNRKNLKTFMSDLYKEKQNWELDTNYQIDPLFPQSKTCSIVFAPDNNFCKYFGVALQSLIENSSSLKYYDIIVLDSNIDNNNKRLLYSMLPKNFNLRFFNIEEFLKEKFNNIELKPKNNWSIAMFYRIFIPIIMQKYSRVLYLDSDIVLNNSIDELFNIDFQNNHILAVRDTIAPLLEYIKYKKRQIYMKKILNLNNPYNYFNSGMIMFNIKEIEIENYLSNFLFLFKDERLLYPDQDILNKIFENKIKFIHSKWNYLYGEMAWNKNFVNLISGEYKKEFIEGMNYPSIIHFTSPKKPWNCPSADYAEIFWKYARKSPFYEEIIYSNMKSQIISRTTINNAIHRKSIYLNYLRCKILKIFSFGKIRNHYEEKCERLKCQVRDYRKTIKAK